MEKSIRIIPGLDAGFQRINSFRTWISRSVVLGAFSLAGFGAMAQMPSGTYTVDPNNQPSSTNFTTINAFFTALSNNGNAIAQGGARLEIYPGNYNERITIPAIAGLGPTQNGTDRLVITSHASGTARIYDAANGSFSNHNGAIIFLNEADYITIENLEIENTSTSTYNNGIQLYKGADHNIINNCEITVGHYTGGSYGRGYAIQTTDYYYPSGGSDNPENLTITNNTITGYYGVYIYGGTSSSGTGWTQGFTLEGNNFHNCNYGLYTYYIYDVDIKDNVWTGPAGYSYYPMYLRYCNNIDVQNNEINNAYYYGLYAYYINRYNTSTVSGRSIIANNAVHGNYKNTSYGYGMYMGYVQSTDVVYNSINLLGDGFKHTTAYGMMLYYDLTNSRIQNNVIKAEASGTNYMIYRYNYNGNYSNGLGIDYNTFYNEAGNGVWYYRGTSTYTDNNLSDHISNSGINTNSQFADPSYVANDDLHVNGVMLYGKGTPIASIGTDVDGTTRSLTAPSPGIHEYIPKDYDAGVVRFDDPVSQCADTNNIIVTVRNYAKLALDSFRVHYQYTGNGGANGSGSMPVVASTPLQPGQDTTLTLGQVYMTSGAPGYTFEAWTTHPNGVTDQQTENDSNLFQTQTAMIDTFTVGSSAGKDFATLTAAVNALVGFGICGPVVFNVEQGKYNEQMLFADLQGTSATNTVLFRPDPNNTGLVEVEYTTGSSSSDASVVKITNSSYITIDGFNIENLSTQYYAHAYQVDGNCTDNAITNSTLTVPTGTNYYSRPIQMQNGGSIFNQTIDGNELYGGYMGFYIYGDYNDGPEGLKFTNNYVTDAYYYGGYIYYQDEFEFSGNEIDMRTATNSQAYNYSYAAYMYNYNANTAIIRDNYMKSNGYGTYIYVAGSKNKGKVEVVNNKFHTGDTTNSTSNYAYYGLRYTGGFGLVAHNYIIREKNYSSNGYTAYMSGGLNDFYNNLVMTVGSGQNMYVTGSFVFGNADNNAYQLVETSNGKPSGGLSTMTGLGYGANSFEISGTNVIFSNLDSLYTCNDSLVGLGVYLTDVPTDINGINRNTSAPTIGAEEYASPDAFTLGDDIKLCDGDTAYIGQEVYNATYSWNTGETTGIIMVTSPGDYSVTVNGGCGQADGDITVLSGEPIASFDPGTPSYLTRVFTNTSTNSDTYSWDFDDGSTSTDENPTHLFPATGTYNVCLTATGECGSTTTCQEVEVSDYEGIAENGLENAVSVVPNPAKDVLFVNVTGIDADVLNIEMSSISGQVVETRQLNEFNGTAKEEFDVEKLTGGVYFVKVYTNEASTTQRVVVQK